MVSLLNVTNQNQKVQTICLCHKQSYGLTVCLYHILQYRCTKNKISVPLLTEYCRNKHTIKECTCTEPCMISTLNQQTILLNDQIRNFDYYIDYSSQGRHFYDTQWTINLLQLFLLT